MKTDRMLTAQRLRDVLDYESETGVFRWKIERRRVRVGDVAGCVHPNRYRRISVDGLQHPAHRLAWLYVHDVWPTDQIDHINGDRDDNRIANLREATNRENCHNLHGLSRRNTSGVLGVSRDRGRWRAHLQVDGRQRNLGCFATLEEAAAAYRAGKRELHPFWAGD